LAKALQPLLDRINALEAKIKQETLDDESKGLIFSSVQREMDVYDKRMTEVETMLTEQRSVIETTVLDRVGEMLSENI
jgi:hypothetical protein